MIFFFLSFLFTGRFDEAGVASPRKFFEYQVREAEKLHSKVILSPDSNVRQISSEFLQVSILSKENNFQTDKLSASLIARLNRLKEVQNADGTWTIKWNYESPPDSAFVIYDLLLANEILNINFSDFQNSSLKKQLQALLETAGKALLTGGIHTPNHRWLMTACLAGLFNIFKKDEYLQRAEAWLHEGIDQDADGIYSERSSSRYSPEVNHWLIQTSRWLNRPSLLNFVRKNLEASSFLIRSDFEIENILSRRADQFLFEKPSNYYFPYLYLAQLEKRGDFLYWAEEILKHTPVEKLNIRQLVYYYMNLPTHSVTPITAPKSYRKYFASSKLFREQVGEFDYSIFSGTDQNLGVGSGLSSNPTFLSLKKGKISLDSVRMSVGFFGMGFVLPQKFDVLDNEIKLSETKKAAYHQPLRSEFIQQDGKYTLESEGRFFSAMDFNLREKTFKTLQTEIQLLPSANGLKLRLHVNGPEKVWVTLELCFREGGEFSGLTTETKNGKSSQFLKAGFGKYQIGSDSLEFGPGSYSHSETTMYGENYLVYGGQLTSPGRCAYLTWLTPVETDLSFQ